MILEPEKCGGCTSYQADLSSVGQKAHDEDVSRTLGNIPTDVELLEDDRVRLKSTTVDAKRRNLDECHTERRDIDKAVDRAAIGHIHKRR